MNGRMGYPPATASWVMLVAGLLAAAACGGGQPSVNTHTPTSQPTSLPTPTVTPSLTTASPVLAATPQSTPFHGTREPIESQGTVPVPPGALLADVRAARHDGFDRLVFEFKVGVPGYRIEYVQPPILEDASGLPVQIEGNAFLQVRFHVAAAHDPDTGKPTYSGPLDIASGLPSLLEVKQTGDFEGYLTWVLGLAQEVDFRVSELGDPFRLVLDVAHP